MTEIVPTGTVAPFVTITFSSFRLTRGISLVVISCTRVFLGIVCGIVSAHKLRSTSVEIAVVKGDVSSQTGAILKSTFPVTTCLDYEKLLV